MLVYIPVTSLIGRNFKFSTVISFNDVTLYFLAVANNLTGWLETVPFLS